MVNLHWELFEFLGTLILITLVHGGLVDIVIRLREDHNFLYLCCNNSFNIRHVGRQPIYVDLFVGVYVRLAYILPPGTRSGQGTALKCLKYIKLAFYRRFGNNICVFPSLVVRIRLPLVVRTDWLSEQKLPIATQKWSHVTFLNV